VAQVIHQADRSASTREAIGAALGLLGTFVAAMFFAFFLPRLAIYVTFLMPVLVGFLLSAVGSLGPRRFGFGNARALVMFMVLGSLVAWAGHHIFAYLRMVDFLASQADVSGSAADATAAALAWIAESTGESGFWGYLAFVSSGPAATYSPVGMLGKTGLGTSGTVIVALVELALMAVTASWTILFRTRGLRSYFEARPLAQVDKETLAAMMKLVEERRFSDAGAALAATGEASHVVLLRDGEVTTEVSVHTVAPDGQPGERVAMKLVSREGGAELRRAFDAARRGS
jgi:hypothetical protein